MSNCSVCGEPTQLHVLGKPICVKCDSVAVQERRICGERREASPKAVTSRAPDGRSQASA